MSLSGLCLLLATCFTGQAADSLSPVYADQFGAQGYDPALDQDGDGALTCEEQVFYTDPTDSNDFPQIRVSRQQMDWVLEWNSVSGVLYRVEEGDLSSDWDVISLPVPGDGTVRTLAPVPTADFSAYRMVAVNDDPDGDGLSGADEAVLGTEPGKWDSDGDRLGDLFEWLEPNLDPLTPQDPNLDQTGTGQPDRVDFASSLSTSVATWAGGATGSWHQAGNWSPPTVPGSADVVLLPTGVHVSATSPAACLALLGDGDLTVDGVDLQIRNLLQCTRLVLTNGATLVGEPGRYASLFIQANGDVTLDATSAIDVTGGGYPAGMGPGSATFGTSRAAGGSHGGRGGAGSTVMGEDLGPCYGSVTEPTALGSGANKGDGAGGGVVCLFASGTLRIDGAILADGDSDSGSSGAGGSIWVQCNQLEGTGTCSAQGAGQRQGGAGGGGRIAVYYDASSFTGSILANGGLNNAGRPGGAGSVYLRDRSAPRGLLRYDNGLPAPPTNLQDGLTVIVDSSLQLDADIEILGGSRLTSLITQPLTIDTPGSVHIASGAEISGYARGYAPMEGPGAPPVFDVSSPIFITPAAAHAGGGGPGFANAVPIDVSYGDFRQPIELGSGAFTWGGGALRLLCGTLIHDGLISVDAEGGFFNEPTGAGGSVWISCQDFTGTGEILANGGYGGGPSMGSGSGGRIAVYADTASYTGTLEASSRADLANQDNGAAGTVLTVFGEIDSLVVDNRSDNPGERTILDPITRLEGDLTVGSGARVSLIPGETDERLEVIVRGDITVEAGGVVELADRNYGEVLHPRFLVNTCFVAPIGPYSSLWGGFEHGSAGYTGPAYPPPGPVPEGYEAGGFEYGTLYSARTTGSGESAGGAIALSSEGTLHIDGAIDASSGEERYYIGPSGGSIFLCGETVAGSGTLDVGGGDFDWPPLVGTLPFAQLMPGGDAGRISIYTETPYSNSLEIRRLRGVGAAAEVFIGPPADCILIPPTVTEGPEGGSVFVATFPLTTHTGAIREIPPPGDLRQDALESDQHIHLFPANKVRLVDTGWNFLSINIPYFGPVTLDASAPGTYDDGGDLAPIVLENTSGTYDSLFYTSYILHADATTGANPTLTGSVTFDEDIVGVRVLDLDGIVLREIMGAPFLLTPNNDNGLELDAGDSFTISPDQRTLTVSLTPGAGIDRLIVVTELRDDNDWTP